MARYDLIAAALTGPHQSGLGDTASLGGRNKVQHLHIALDAERVILERVELVEVQIDNPLLLPTGSVLGLGTIAPVREAPASTPPEPGGVFISYAICLAYLLFRM